MIVLSASPNACPICAQVAEANALRQTKIAQAEADVISEKGKAAAEVMELKADAWMSCESLVPNVVLPTYHTALVACPTWC